MARDEVAELDELQWSDRLARDPEAIPALEALRRHPVRIQVRVMQLRHPGGLDHVNAPVAVVVEPVPDVVVTRVRVRPEACPRAIAWEPVQRQVPRIDGVDERLVPRVLGTV